MFPGLTPLRGLIIFFLLLFCSIYFFQIYPYFISPNEQSRVLLTSAIVDDGTFQIDKALNRFGNSPDKAFYNGHYYSDKAIGVSLLGIPVYIMLKLFRVQPEASIYLFWLKLFCVTIPSILFVIFLSHYWKNAFNGRFNLSLAFIYLFGTIVFPYSLQFISHHLTGTAFFLSFYFGWKAGRNEVRVAKNLILSGIFAGAAMIMEYPAVFQAGILFLYAFMRLPSLRKRAFLFVLGLSPFIFLMLGYNYAIFGTPFDVTYKHMSDQTHVLQHSEGFIGLRLPNPRVLLALLFSSSRGLFFCSPVLLLSIPGVFRLIENNRFRLEGVLILGMVLSNVLFHAGMSNWDGGWSLGPRYLTPIIPFMMTAIAYYLSSETSLKPAKMFLYICTSIISIFIITAGTITFPFPAEEITNPVFSVFLPMMMNGAYSLNIPEILGIHGLTIALLFYTTLVISFIVICTDGRDLHFRNFKEFRVPLAAITCSVIVLIGGVLYTPPLNAFQHYARASMYFFVGDCGDSYQDLKEARDLDSDKHLNQLIMQRLWELKQFCRDAHKN